MCIIFYTINAAYGFFVGLLTYVYDIGKFNPTMQFHMLSRDIP